MIELTIVGEVIPKKNSRINTRSGRSFPNQKYIAWETSAVKQVLVQMVGKQRVISYPVTVTMEFFYGSNRKKDISNSACSVEDMLVESGVLIDDNYTCINELIVRFVGVDRNNPRVIVRIT